MSGWRFFVFSKFCPNGTNLFPLLETFSATFTSTITFCGSSSTHWQEVTECRSFLIPGSGLNTIGLPGANFTANCSLQSNLIYLVTVAAG